MIQNKLHRVHFQNKQLTKNAQVSDCHAMMPILLLFIVNCTAIMIDLSSAYNNNRGRLPL